MKQSTLFTPLLLALAAALCLLMLTGCAPAEVPETPETIAAATAVTQAADQSAPLPTGSFVTADGSAEFTWDLGEIQELAPMPIVEVKPHFLTGEDMKKICTGLLGDVPFYDLGPRTQRQLSRDQIQRKIDIMNLYQDQESLSKLWSYSQDNAAIFSEHQSTLDFLNQALETAPAENNLPPCTWQIKNEADYDDYMDTGIYQTLRATANVNGIDYYCDLFLNKQETEHSRVSNWMKLSLGDGSEDYTVERHIRSQLCTSPEPTQAQYDVILQKAQSMLDAMGIGEYKAVNPRYDPNYFDDGERFEIYVDAVPVFEGAPALAGHWGQKYLEQQDFPSYGVTKGIFSFSPKGDLVNFNLGSLVEQTRVIEPAAEVLPISELLNKAQTILTAYDVNAISISAGNWILWQHGPENMTCKVSITGVDYGLVRYSIDGSEDTFVYTPAIVCKGTAAYYDKLSGELITTSDDTSAGIGQAPLVVLDAISGGVI